MSKILVVDDEVKACKLLKRFLEAKEHEVVTTGNGIEALEKLKSDPVDLIIDITERHGSQQSTINNQQSTINNLQSSINN